MEKLFKYNEKATIRTIYDNDGEIWFAGIDVCNILGYAKASTTIERLDEDEKKLEYLTDTSGQKRKSWNINESGLYSLILSSTKSEAKMFKRWITHEVLPSIRKAGIYSTDKDKAKQLRLQELRKLIEDKKNQLSEKQSLLNQEKADIKKLEVEFWEVFNTESSQLKLFSPDEMEKIKG